MSASRFPERSDVAGVSRFGGRLAAYCGGRAVARGPSTAYLIEPVLTGKAVDLSPLAILLALAFWGLCWGLEGMFLAVPLTVVLRIVLDNLPATRPLARLMGEG